MTKPHRDSLTCPSHKPFAAVATVSLVVALFGACSDPYDSCEAKRNCRKTSGGEAGAAGDGTSNSGGSTDGGAAGSSGVAGGGGGADVGGGASGASASGGDDSGGSTGGTSTEGGSGGDAGRAGNGDSGGGSGEGGSGGADGGPRCGDGNVNDGEACDDGNNDAADGCRPNCTWGPKEVVAGVDSLSSCAVFGNGATKCWGYNRGGELAQGDTVNRGDGPNEMGSALDFITVEGRVANFDSLSIGAGIACGVVEQQVWCWGSRKHLGQATTDLAIITRPVLVAVGGAALSVSVGRDYACVLLTTGVVKCWGANDYGQLGVGSSQFIGDEPNEMGINLRSVQLGSKAVRVRAGTNHACAVLEAGNSACWGRNDVGQLGLGTVDNFGDSGTELSPPALVLGAKLAVSDISPGTDHTCALIEGALKCWGKGTCLGLGTIENWGDNESLAALPWVVVTTPTGSEPVVSVESSGFASCALMRSGSVKCWGLRGWPIIAQPALRTTETGSGTVASLPPIDLGPGAAARTFAEGSGHACALFATGDVKCWGRNDYGQLGLGHTMPVGNVASELGANMKAVQLD